MHFFIFIKNIIQIDLFIWVTVDKVCFRSIARQSLSRSFYPVSVKDYAHFILALLSSTTPFSIESNKMLVDARLILIKRNWQPIALRITWRDLFLFYTVCR